MHLELKGNELSALWTSVVQHKLDARSKCGMSEADYNRLKQCIVYMRAVASPQEQASVDSLAPGAAVRPAGLKPPATAARDVAAKLFLRVSHLEKAHGLKEVNSRKYTVNAILERIIILAAKDSTIHQQLTRAPVEPFELPAEPAAAKGAAAAKSRKAAKRARADAAAEAAANKEERRAAVGAASGGG